MQERTSLRDKIKHFSKHKLKWAILFILLGLLGLVLPVIPGILLLAVGLFLLKPEWFDKFRRKAVRKEQKQSETGS